MSQCIALNRTSDYLDVLQHQYGFTVAYENDHTYVMPPKDIGDGHLSIYRPSKNIEIFKRKLNLRRPIEIHYEHMDFGYEVAYCIKGYLHHKHQRYDIRDLGIFINDNSQGTILLPADEDIQTVSVRCYGDMLAYFPYRDELVQKTEQYMDLTETMKNPQNAGVQVDNLFNQLMNSQMDHRIYAVSAEGISKQVLSQIWQSQVLNIIENNHNLPDYDYQAVQTAKKIIEKDFLSPPSVNELSLHVGLNAYKLQSAFREVYGKTIYEMVKYVRLENAKALMENEELTVSQIAYAVGYINTSHFAKAFRNMYGMNPKAYRKGL